MHFSTADSGPPSLILITLRKCLFSNENYGEMSLETAQAWYEYGNVLLLKEEENPSNDVLGNVQHDPSHPNVVPEDDDVGEEDAPDDAAEAEDEEGGEEGEFADEDEPEGDLQIAWEALDVSNAYFYLRKSNDPFYDIIILHGCEFRWPVRFW